MNDPEFVEAARVFGEQILQHGGATTGERLDLGLPPRRCRGLRGTRSVPCWPNCWRPTGRSTARIGKRPMNCSAIGAHPVPGQIDHVELAAWTSVCRTILNLHETITRN